MNIVHICMTQYSDGWTYQENMITKYQKLEGHNVTVITSMLHYDEGKLVEDTKMRFEDINGVKIIRLRKKTAGLMKKIPTYEEFDKTLKSLFPDIIFSHGCQYKDIKSVAEYVKNNRNVKLFVDNHADYTNSATNVFSKYILHKVIWRHYAHVILPYVQKFYGVLPARVDFLIDVYKLPKSKCELLVMGADDEQVVAAEDINKIQNLRNEYCISADDFLIVTGGKIDKAKIQTVLLMEAVAKLNSNRIKLIVFGSIDNKIKKEVLQWVDGKKIMYAGWINARESYVYFSAADLVIFPGRHSVFWEQAAGQGKPMIVKDWPGTHHIDVGGNVKFLTSDSVTEIKNLLCEIVNKPQVYEEMKNCAIECAKAKFSYKLIAKYCIGEI